MKKSPVLIPPRDAEKLLFVTWKCVLVSKKSNLQKSYRPSFSAQSQAGGWEKDIEKGGGPAGHVTIPQARAVGGPVSVLFLLSC